MSKKINKNSRTKLTPKQLKFIDKYLETGNGTQSYKEVYNENANDNTAGVMANQLLRNIKIAEEIERRQAEMRKNSIATAQEVMEYFTKVMNGEIKDQFGLDAPLGERTKAAQELAKRTVDIENRIAGKADAEVRITLDWSGFKEGE